MRLLRWMTEKVDWTSYEPVEPMGAPVWPVYHQSPRVFVLSGRILYTVVAIPLILFEVSVMVFCLAAVVMLPIVLVLGIGR